MEFQVSNLKSQVSDLRFQTRRTTQFAAGLARRSAALSLLCLLAAAPADGPISPRQLLDQQRQSQPSPQQPANAEAPELKSMKQWFAELDDADASVRESARVKLMGLRRRDLGAFQKMVRESAPLAPAQAAVLRQIVTHVYLAGEPYDTTGAEGFLGVKMQESNVRLPAADGVEQLAPAVGVVIVERFAGFVGARMLLDGDVILGIVERPDVRTMGMYEFQMVVKSVTPGTTIHFQIMRQGQVIRVPVTPDPRPFEADGLMSDLIYRRQRRADEYWERTFAGLVKEGVG